MLEFAVIDIPIELTERTPRQADLYEASRIRRKLDGKGCSRQTYMILDKIQEAHQVVNPALQGWFVEGHPEVSFAVMNEGRPMTYRKSRRSHQRTHQMFLLN